MDGKFLKPAMGLGYVLDLVGKDCFCIIVFDVVSSLLKEIAFSSSHRDVIHSSECCAVELLNLGDKALNRQG